jgi:Uma2 family endonuclease
MSSAPKRILTEQEYLEIERAADFKSEFYNGEMFRMQGATRQHVVVSGNIFAELHLFFKESPCEVYANDMRLRVKSSGLYTYPDVMATCEKPEFAENEFDNFTNPQVIFEVLSKSTEKYDRTFKLDRYQKLPSLKSYLLVAQDEPRVEQYARSANGEWIYSSAHEWTDSLTIKCIDYELKLSEVYARIEFPEPPQLRSHLAEEQSSDYILPRPGMPV